ncbi:protein of unknown function [Methylocaldum szegediense]|uniref:Uncharacterized protein n=1 Tax=Methylocaldum szegediense TaxID=73780 RepID=A0ABN8X3F1_9GAMM|nr:protein of unknown function [Methylocaldum szegediense]
MWILRRCWVDRRRPTLELSYPVVASDVARETLRKAMSIRLRPCQNLTGGGDVKIDGRPVAMPLAS